MKKFRVNKQIVIIIISSVCVIQLVTNALLVWGIISLRREVSILEEEVDSNTSTLSSVVSQIDEQEEEDESSEDTSLSDTLELDFKGEGIVIKMTREETEEESLSFFNLEIKSVSYPDGVIFIDAVYEDGTSGTYLFYLEETDSFYQLFPSGASRLSLIGESEFEEMLGTSTSQNGDSITITECSRGSTKINEIEFDTLECEYTDTPFGEDIDMITNSVECLYEVPEGLYFIYENISSTYGSDIDTCASLSYMNVVSIDVDEY